MLKTTIDNYKRAKELYNIIDDKFNDIEYGNINNTEFVHHQILNELDELEKCLKKIKIDDIKNNYDNETIEAVTYNYEFIQEALYYWQRKFLGGKYALGLVDPITLKYVPGLDLNQEELDLYGGEKKLAKKIIATLTSDLYVKEYENSIKRIILGTMHQNEFNRMFDVLKHKIILPKEDKDKFISLMQYKKDKN